MGLRRKGYQHIHIAIRSKICPQDGAKQGKLGDIPAFAKLGKSGFRDSYLDSLHTVIITQPYQPADEGYLGLAVAFGVPSAGSGTTPA